jgi:ATP-dependent DNA helicase 2 subunit 2
MYSQFSGTKEKTKRLEISLDCIKLMLQQKLFYYKNHEVCHSLHLLFKVGLILFGTEEAEDGKTIYVQDIQKVDLSFIRNVGELAGHEVP